MGWVAVEWTVIVVLAYLMGSIPSAYIAGRLVNGRDIREEGDQNPGAGNVFRALGARVGVAVGVADIGKATVAVLVASGLAEGAGAQMAAGFAVVAGHNWPVFLQLSGGRGAASAIGVFIGLVPIVALPLSLIALVFLPVVKSASVGIGIIFIPFPLLAWLSGSSDAVVAYTVGLPIMVGMRHYYTTRRVHRRQRDQAGGQALPQG